MTIEQGTLVALGGWIGASIFWASRQSGRIDAMKELMTSELQRRDDRIKNCEVKAEEQGGAIIRIDDRTRIMDTKLSRIMGRLGVPHRAEDLDSETS